MTRLLVADMTNFIGELTQLRPKYDTELHQRQVLEGIIVIFH